MKTLLKRILLKFGYRMECVKFQPRQLLDVSLLRELEFNDAVARRMSEVGPHLNFLQVGVYDGITHDPLNQYIRRFGWHGVLVEPQAKSASLLRALYGDYSNVTVIQAALSATAGEQALYTVVGDGAPAWAGGLASFQRETILKHTDMIPGLEAMLYEEIVECVTFDQVFDRMGPVSVDILQIDTEGADGYLLSLFPFERVKPWIIQWEIKHLSKAQQEECFERLARFGYRFARSGGEDMMALRF